MKLISRAYNKSLAFLGISANKDPRSFFDYSSKEKKQIINQAAEEANRMQRELVAEYNRRHTKIK